MQTSTFLVAELSANHNQDKNLALKTIKAAKVSGASAIKLQTYTPQCMTIDSKLDYFKIKGTIWNDRNYYELYKEAMTPWEWHRELFDYANELGLVCFSTPFSKEGVDFLESINNPIYKIASFEIVDLELISYIAQTKKPLIISKGIATKEEIHDALEVCKNVSDITLLQCTSSYPAPLNEANLMLIPKLKEDFKEFNIKVGLSDHTLGITAPITAVALGAKVIEKHFILDRNLGGVDSTFSLEPDEFKKMTEKIQEVEELLGNGSYELSQKQIDGRIFMRSLFAIKDIKKGEAFTRDNIKSIRPGYGLPPKMMHEILGKKATKNINMGEPLQNSDFES